MSWDMKTPDGHNMFTMSSMLQKAIRRGDIEHASYAAKELMAWYRKYMWRRLLVISAEDCYGIMTKEIVGLMYADEIVNKDRKGYDKDSIFVSKAVLLLCMARKNRDACYVACNFLHDERKMKLSDIPEEYTCDVDMAKLTGEIPKWVYDIHTREGRRAGKTDLDMTIDEQEALEPKQLSLFDFAGWQNYYEIEFAKGNITGKEKERVIKWMQGKQCDPTKNGEKWAEDIIKEYMEQNKM